MVLKVLICGGTSFFRSTVLSVYRPQWIQSLVPSLVRFTWLGGVVTAPCSMDVMVGRAVERGEETCGPCVCERRAIPPPATPTTASPAKPNTTARREMPRCGWTVIESDDCDERLAGHPTEGL